MRCKWGDEGDGGVGGVEGEDYWDSQLRDNRPGYEHMRI